jgi:hypothetical protein
MIQPRLTRSARLSCLAFFLSLFASSRAADHVLVEVEGLQQKGGWVVDQQFILAPNSILSSETTNCRTIPLGCFSPAHEPPAITKTTQRDRSPGAFSADFTQVTK